MSTFGDYKKLMDKENQVRQEALNKLSNQLRESDAYLEKYLPIQTQLLIDETLYNTVSKTKDLFKAFSDFSKFKFKILEEKLKTGL